MPPRLDGPVDERTFVVAATVAEIEADLAASPRPVPVAFDRAHVHALREAGATKEQVREYLATLFNPVQVERVMSDLDSYGEWAG